MSLKKKEKGADWFTVEVDSKGILTHYPKDALHGLKSIRLQVDYEPEALYLQLTQGKKLLSSAVVDGSFYENFAEQLRKGAVLELQTSIVQETENDPPIPRLKINSLRINTDKQWDLTHRTAYTLEDLTEIKREIRRRDAYYDSLAVRDKKKQIKILQRTENDLDLEDKISGKLVEERGEEVEDEDFKENDSSTAEDYIGAFTYPEIKRISRQLGIRRPRSPASPPSQGGGKMKSNSDPLQIDSYSLIEQDLSKSKLLSKESEIQLCKKIESAKNLIQKLGSELPITLAMYFPSEMPKALSKSLELLHQWKINYNNTNNGNGILEEYFNFKPFDCDPEKITQTEMELESIIKSWKKLGLLGSPILDEVFKNTDPENVSFFSEKYIRPLGSLRALAKIPFNSQVKKELIRWAVERGLQDYLHKKSPEESTYYRKQGNGFRLNSSYFISKYIEGEVNYNQLVGEFAKANMRLVRSYVNRFSGYCSGAIALTDLFQEGNLGLLRAIKKFDWRKGHKFSTYATWWIYQGISKYAKDNNSSIRIPLHLQDKIHNIKKYYSNFTQLYDREPTAEELDLEFPPGQQGKKSGSDILKEARSAKVYSLNSNINTEDDSEKFKLDKYIDGNEENLVGFMAVEKQSETQVYDQELLEKNNRIISEVLGKREAEIIRKRFGLYPYQKIYTLEAIGNTFGLTRERIRQLEQISMLRLKEKIIK